MDANSTFTKAAHDLLYHPLNSDIREIRVLRIERSEPDTADIRCTLETISLNAAPLYQALSYEWGPHDVGEPESRVLLNDHPVVTTPNLRLALRHLGPGPFYWIDALCIDQSNDKERGHQVRLMTEIYRNASAVLAWLGSEEGDSGKGMKLLNELENLIVAFKHLADFDDQFHKSVYDSFKNEAHRVYWNGLEQIFKRSYWTRLWIIQELLVSPNGDEVWLPCGPSKARFTTLGVLKKHLNAIHHDLPTLCPQGSVEHLIIRIQKSGKSALFIADHANVWRRSSKTEEHYTSTLRLLRIYWEQLCTDPRDKIYALLGVSFLYSHEEFPITYATPVLDVYKSFAQYEIAGSNSLYILTYSGYDQCNVPVWPSWVPNWQSEKRQLMIKPFWSSSGDLLCISSYSDDGNMLITRAFIVGPITCLFETGTFYSSELDFDTVDSARASGRKELNSWLDFIKNAIETDTQKTALSTTNMKNAYELLFFLDKSADKAERELPLPKFYGLYGAAEMVSVAEGVPEAEEELLHDRALYGMRYRRQLCSINLTPSTHSANDQVLPGSTDPDKETTVGLCSLNARIGDVVTVVRGCRHPILLRQVEDEKRYEVIGEIYICGFMRGEALKRFEEVEIELV